MMVFIVMRRQEIQVRAFALGLPDRLRRLDPVFLGRLVFGQYNPVPAFRVAADGGRLVPELRMFQELHRTVEAIHITMQDGTVFHGLSAN